MMIRTMHLRPILAAPFVLIAACGPGPDAVPRAADTAPEASAEVAPAIVAPEEVYDPAEPPSYEVAIASAAAERNRARQRCAEQPEAVRAQCEQEANGAFAEAEESLENLRGNQQ